MSFVVSHVWVDYLHVKAEFTSNTAPVLSEFRQTTRANSILKIDMAKLDGKNVRFKTSNDG